MVDAIVPIARAMRGKSGDFVDNVVRESAIQTAEKIRKSPDVSGLIRAGKIKIVPARYDLGSGMVEYIGFLNRSRPFFQFRLRTGAARSRNARGLIVPHGINVLLGPHRASQSLSQSLLAERLTRARREPADRPAWPERAARMGQLLDRSGAVYRPG